MDSKLKLGGGGAATFTLCALIIAKRSLIGGNIYCWKTEVHLHEFIVSPELFLTHIKACRDLLIERLNLRWDAGSCQNFSLHGVKAFTFTNTKLDLHPVVGVVLEEEAIVDHKLGIGSRAIKDVDLWKEHVVRFYKVLGSPARSEQDLYTLAV